MINFAEVAGIVRISIATKIKVLYSSRLDDHHSSKSPTIAFGPSFPLELPALQHLGWNVYLPGENAGSGNVL
jgi:hypothetical protein